MPAASSPYSQNDYQASRFQGYRLPVNSIFKAISDQDQFWKIGAQRVNSVYNNALNLKLSLEPNKKLRDDFLHNAEQQIVDISSKNLADPSVQREGFNIFKPLFQDEGIVSDDEATRRIESIKNDINNAREKENGKYYNNNNAMYALDGVYEFQNSKDRFAGKQYLQKARNYEPYYDFSGEMNNIMKNCHPEKYSRDVQSGLNIFTYSTESLSSLRLSGCIDAGLSDKAKRQLSIDGYVTYKNNPGALRDAYLPMIQGTRSQLQEQNAAFSGILANKDNLKNLSTVQLSKLGLTSADQITPELIQSFSDRKQANDLRLSNLNDTITKLQTGDFSPISGDNLEPVASAVYSKGYADNYGAAFSYDPPPSVKIKADAAQMLIYRERAEDARQEDQQDFLRSQKLLDIEAGRELQMLKNLAVKGKGKNGEITADDILNSASLNPAFEQDVEATGSYDKLTQESINLKNKIIELDKKFLPKLRELGMDSGDVSDKDFADKNEKFQAWYNNFRGTLDPNNSSDPKWLKIKQYEDQMNKLKVQQALIRNNQNEIDEQSVREIGPNPANAEYQRLSSQPRFFVGAGIGDKNAGDIINDINAGRAKLRVDNSLKGNKVLTYMVNGQMVEIDTVQMGYGSRAQQMNNILSDVHKYYKSSNDYDNKLSTKRNAIAETKTIVQKEGYSFPELNEKDNPIKLRVLQDAGLNPEDFSAVSIGQTDLGALKTGGAIEVTIHPDNASNPKWEVGDILDRLKAKYGDRLKELPGGDKNHFQLTGFPELDKFTSPEMKMSDLMIPYIRALKKQVTDEKPKSTGLLPSVVPDKQYGMRISTSLTPGAYSYEIYDETGNTIMYFNDDEIRALEYLNASLRTGWKQKGKK